MILFGIILFFIAFFVLKKWFHKRAIQKRYQNYEKEVTLHVEKWKGWEQNGIPTIESKHLIMDKGEDLLASVMFRMRVGESRKTDEGILHITNTRFLFTSMGNVKQIPYDKIVSVMACHEYILITPDKKGKMLQFVPVTDTEEELRLTLADVYAMWFLLNRGKYSEMEENILSILGVCKVVTTEQVPNE